MLPPRVMFGRWRTRPVGSALNPGQLVEPPPFDAVAVAVLVSPPLEPLGHVDEVGESGLRQQQQAFADLPPTRHIT